MRFLERIEIGALDVLDDGQLELVAVGELPDHRRDALQTGRAGRADPALAGDQDVTVEGLRHDHRLQDPVLAHAGGQRRQLLLVHVATWLIRIRGDPSQRHIVDADVHRSGRDQGREPSAQSGGGPFRPRRHEAAIA